MIKALARALRWRKMLDTNAGLDDPANGIAPFDVSRVLWLTLLAPEFGEAILDRRQRTDCTGGRDSR